MWRWTSYFPGARVSVGDMMRSNVGNANVENITNQNHLLLWKGTAAARMKKCCWGKYLEQEKAERKPTIGAVLLSSLVLPSPSSGPHWQSLTGSSRSNRNVVRKAPAQNHKANYRTGAGAKRQWFTSPLPLTLQDSEGFAILSFVDCYQESYWI